MVTYEQYISETMNIVVRGDLLILPNGKSYRCAVGRSGIALKRGEGDGVSPEGTWPLREVWYRADRLPAPKTALPIRTIDPNDGWVDAPDHPAYNKHVLLPCTASHERLWRDDDLYDVLAVVGFNDAPVIAGRGSAIFMHVARADYGPTAGCVALKREDLLEVLSCCERESVVTIERS